MRPLADRAEGLSAGHQQSETIALAQKRFCEVRDGFDDVLAGIEYEERATRVQLPDQRGLHIAIKLDVQCFGDRRYRALGVGDVREIDKGQALLKGGSIP